MAPNPTTDVLVRKERFEGTEETQERRPCDEGDRERRDVAIGQGSCRIVGNHQNRFNDNQNLEETRKIFLLMSLEGAWPC